mmetsp:Transcript_17642/g.21381  ORF Transcript_17642/g.21381 Transcript_17642/m.21381 type:complete len:258 (+) Transcript_17642:247-1020(+)
MEWTDLSTQLQKLKNKSNHQEKELKVQKENNKQLKERVDRLLHLLKIAEEEKETLRTDTTQRSQQNKNSNSIGARKYSDLCKRGSEQIRPSQHISLINETEFASSRSLPSRIKQPCFSASKLKRRAPKKETSMLTPETKCQTNDGLAGAHNSSTKAAIRDFLKQPISSQNTCPNTESVDANLFRNLRVNKKTPSRVSIEQTPKSEYTKAVATQSKHKTGGTFVRNQVFSVALKTTRASRAGQSSFQKQSHSSKIWKV